MATRRARALWVAGGMLLLAACSAGSSTETADGSPSPQATASAELETETDASPSPRRPISDTDFDPADFDDSSATIDNAYLPLEPGARWVMEGRALDEGEPISRRVVRTVTGLTKVISGVRTLAILELDFTDDELVESEIALFAQDRSGNVWFFGEYPEEWDGEQIDKTPAWAAGLQGARPGIAMQVDPHLGDPDYAQGWGPKVRWDDRGQTYAVDERTCVPVDCYDGVLVVKEFSRSEPGAFQTKFYARGMGNVRVGWGGPNEEEHEVLKLVEMSQLSPDELTKVERQTLEQERRGFELSPKVWALTPPLEPLAA